MSAWWSYRPEDFLLFSADVYWRLFERMNTELWPAPFFALILGGGLLVHATWPRPWSGRFVAATLAAAWLFTGWWFFLARYAEINWAANYVAAAFFVQAPLVLAVGGFGQRLLPAATGPRRLLGLSMLCYAIALHPLIAPLAGRPLAAAEVFGLAPDPTAIATLGGLALAGRRRIALLLAPLPVVWCVTSWLTLNTMGAWEAWIPFAAVLAYAAAMLWPASPAAAPSRLRF